MARPRHAREEGTPLHQLGEAEDGAGLSGDDDEGGESGGGGRRRSVASVTEHEAPPAGAATRPRRAAAPSNLSGGASLGIGVALATAAAGLLLLLLRRRRGRQAPLPACAPTRRGPRRGAPARPALSAATAAAWIDPPGELLLLPAEPAASVSGALAGSRIVFCPSLAAHPALPALAGAGAAVLGSIPDGAAACGPGPLAPDGAPRGSPNPAVPRGGALLAGPGARAAAAVAAGAADACLTPSPPTALPWALAAACGLAALRTPTATLAARSLEDLTAAALAGGLARAGPQRAADPVLIIFGGDLFDGCGGSTARVAALPAAARLAAEGWASEGQVASGFISNFMADRCPAVVDGGLVTRAEWEGRAVLRGLRRAAAMLAGEEAGAAADGQHGSLEAAREAADQAAAALSEATAGGDLLLIPSLPGPHPPAGGGEAGAAARAAWSNATRGLASLAGISGLVALSIPVPATAGEAFPAGVTLVGGVGSEGAVLAAGAGIGQRLGPAWVAALAQAEASLGAAAAAAAAEDAPASPSSSAASAMTTTTTTTTTTTARRTAPAPASTSPGQAAPLRAGKTAAARTAETLRRSGNTSFVAGDWEGAIQAYTAASAADPACPLALSNRAAAHLNLFRFDEADADATASLALAKTAKALLRRAAARRGLGDAGGARADLRAVLALEPGNTQARSDLRSLAEAEAAGFN